MPEEIQDIDHIKAVSLDAAGTLFEVTEPVAQTYARIAAQHDGELDPAALGKGFARHFPEMPPMAFGKADADALPRLERGWWRTLVRRVVAEVGSVDNFDEFFDELFDYYGRVEAWKLYDEVPSVLETLTSAGLQVGVLSNFDSRLLPILEGLGVTPVVPKVLYSTQIGSAKPAPAAFMAMAELLETPVEHCLHVGDNRVADHDGAAQAGMVALHLDRHFGTRPKVRKSSRHYQKVKPLETLSELTNYLKLS